MTTLHRLGIASLFAALAGTASAQTIAAAAPASSATTLAGPQVQERASSLAWWGDLDGLDRLYADIDRPARYNETGHLLKRNFRNGVAKSLETPSKTGAAFMVELDALTAAWATQRPMSPLVHWLRAEALIQNAWEVRGSGLGKTVSPESWAEFGRWLTLGAQHLASTSAVSQQDSSSHVALLTIARGLSWDLDRQRQIVQAGLARNRDDLSLWHQLLTSTLPKWAGSAQQVDRLIRDAAAFHKERGDEIYARLYHAAADEEFSHSVFRDTAADWPRIKKGLRDSIARWPAKAHFWNQMAYFACMSGDRETLGEALDAIQHKPDLEQWGANARRTFEGCQKLARQS